MNLRKIWLSLFAAFFGIMTILPVSSAIVVDSFPMGEIEVSFIDSQTSDNLEGSVWKKGGNFSNASKIMIALVDEKNAISEEQEIILSDEDLSKEVFDKKFVLENKKTDLSGSYSLKAKVFDSNERVIAFGQTSKSFYPADESFQLSLVSDLRTKEKIDSVEGIVSFENNISDGDFMAKVDIYRDGSKREYVGTFNSEKTSLKKGETKDISFNIKKPTIPQLYEMEVSIIKDGEQITGKLIGTFLVEGYFGEFYSVDVNPKKYIEKGETIDLKFSGATNTEKSKTLSVEIQMTDNDGYSETKFVNVSPENDSSFFNGKEVFLATKGINQLVIKMLLWDGNNELANFTYSTELHKKERDINLISKITTIKLGEELSSSDKVKIVVVLALILLAIIIFIRGLVRSNKGRKFFIFFGILLFSANSFAANPTGTFYPMDGMSYNPDSGAGYFSDIGFWGYISDPLLGGLLPVTSENIDYEVTISNGTESEVVSGSFTNQNSYEYKFSINTPAVGASFPEGDYDDLSIRLYGTPVETRLNDLDGGTGSLGTDITINLIGTTINIDDTDPVLDFSFSEVSSGSVIDNGPNTPYQDGDYINETFNIMPTCNDSGSGCNKVYQQFNVTGNFCDETDNSRDFCEDFVHEFQICDTAGNCAPSESSDIDFYDPVKPVTNGGDFVDTNGGSIFDVQIGTGGLQYNPFSQYFAAANAAGGISIMSSALGNDINLSILNGYTFALDSTSDPSTDPSQIVNDYVCEESTEFYKETVSGEEICVESEIICAISPTVRGISTDGGTTCSPLCPSGYTYNLATNFCEPECYHDRFPYCFNIIVETP